MITHYVFEGPRLTFWFRPDRNRRSPAFGWLVEENIGTNHELGSLILYLLRTEYWIKLRSKTLLLRREYVGKSIVYSILCIRDRVRRTVVSV